MLTLVDMAVDTVMGVIMVVVTGLVDITDKSVKDVSRQ
jgi:hypothetical protein